MSSSTGVSSGGSDVGQVLAPSANVLPPTKMDIQPPTMGRNFELYAVRLQTYLTRMNLWNVVSGVEQRPVAGAQPQTDFDARDNLAKGVILQGMPEPDAEVLCRCTTAHELWSQFVTLKRKKEFSTYIFTKERLLSSKYTADQQMGDWLREMQLMRNELSNYGHPLVDGEFAEILLTNVAHVYRDVVRQFSSHFSVAGAAGDNVRPSSEQVMAALRAEAELDTIRPKDAPPVIGIASQQTKGKSDAKQSSGKQKKKKRKWRGRRNGPSNGNQGQKETRACHKCKKVGHLIAQCPEWSKNKQEKETKESVSSDEDNGMDSVQPERKRWQGNGNSNRPRKNISMMMSRTENHGSDRIRDIGSSGKLSRDGRAFHEWIIDSACDVHVCMDYNLLSHLQSASEAEYVAWDGSVSRAAMLGDATIQVKNVNDGKPVLLQLQGVCYTPTGQNNLLSLDKLEQDGWHPQFAKGLPSALYLTRGSVRLKCIKSNGRYRLCSQEMASVCAFAAATPDRVRSAKTLLHLRFAHANLSDLQRMVRDRRVCGLADNHLVLDATQGMDCVPCSAAQLKRISYKKVTTHRATKPLQKLMSDQCYVGVETFDGFRHFQLLQDEATRYVWVFLLKNKRDATAVVLHHVEFLKSAGEPVEVFASDQGGELVNQVMKSALHRLGIHMIWTNAYSPEENGLVERLNGIIMGRVRSLLTTANMPSSLWGEACRFVVDVYNVTASRALGGCTPYECRFDAVPDVSRLHVWGCLVFVFTPAKKRKTKLENPGKPGIFLGYGAHSLSFRVMLLPSGALVEVRSIKFFESQTVERSYVHRVLQNRYAHCTFTIGDVLPLVPLPVSGSIGIRDTHHLELGWSSDCGECRGVARGEPPCSDVAGPDVAGELRESRRDHAIRTRGLLSDANAGRPVSPAAVMDREGPRLGLSDPSDDDLGLETREWGMEDSSGSLRNARVVSSTPIRGEGMDTRELGLEDSSEPLRSARELGHPSREADDETVDDYGSSDGEDAMDDGDGLEEATPSLRRSTRERRQSCRLRGCAVSLPMSLVIQAVNALTEPTSVNEALASSDCEQWVGALECEFDSLMRNKTWDLVPRPRGVKVLTSKWVFVRKKDAHGRVVRHKARLTIRGCQQQHGVNYWETYAPVVSAEAVRFVLVLALMRGYQARHVDFVTAFLNGAIDDVEIYMAQPEFFDDGSGRVCLLKRSLYGLKQAPRIWYKTLDKWLRKHGWKRSSMDQGVFWRPVGNDVVFLTVYVDDLILVGSPENNDAVLRMIQGAFQVKDLGPVSHLLAMEVQLIRGQVLTISQEHYIEVVLDRFGMKDCAPSSTPQVSGDYLVKPEKPYGSEVNDPSIPYREAVGALQYLVHCSRPDIASVVRHLGQFLTCYTAAHWERVKTVLRYLQGTKSFGLKWSVPAHYRLGQPMTLKAYADADLGNDPFDHHKSVAGVVLQLNGCTFAWKSKKQGVVTEDTCSAEFVAASICSTLIVWIQNLCEEMNVPLADTTLYQDNQGTIAVLRGNRGNYKVRGLFLKYHKVRWLWEEGVFKVVYCPSTEMIADILTKPLDPGPFQKLRTELNVVDLKTSKK